MMLIGMGLMKLGVLSAQAPFKLYAWFAVIGYGIGIPVNSYTAWVMISSNFDPVVQQFASSTYDIGRLSIALGHLGVIMLIAKSGVLRGLMNALGAVGQIAFSNYILHSVITAFLFTGYGFGLYGRLAALPALLRRRHDLGGEPDREPPLASTLPVRPARVVLAVADLLEASTDAAPRRR